MPNINYNTYSTPCKAHGLFLSRSTIEFAGLGVRMDDGFIQTLTEPLSPKDGIYNESRLENGRRRVDDITTRFKHRELNLEFTVWGDTPEEFARNKRSFLEWIYNGEFGLKVPAVSDEEYKLVYTGKGGEYFVNSARTYCKMVLKFEENNPKDRERKHFPDTPL